MIEAETHLEAIVCEIPRLFEAPGAGMERLLYSFLFLLFSTMTMATVATIQATRMPLPSTAPRRLKVQKLCSS